MAKDWSPSDPGKSCKPTGAFCGHLDHCLTWRGSVSNKKSSIMDMSNLILKISKDRNCVVLLGNLLWCWAVLLIHFFSYDLLKGRDLTCCICLVSSSQLQNNSNTVSWMRVKFRCLNPESTSTVARDLTLEIRSALSSSTGPAFRSMSQMEVQTYFLGLGTMQRSWREYVLHL